MANFHHFFMIFSCNIGPVYIRGGWVGGAQGWGGWWQKQRIKKTQIVGFRVAMMCTCTHITKGQYSTTSLRQTCTDSGSHIRSPQPTWGPPLAPFHQSWIYVVSKKHSGKADQSTLVSEFSLCANMSGFCSQTVIIKLI